MDINIKQLTWRRKNGNKKKGRILVNRRQFNATSSQHRTDIRPAYIQFTDHLVISLKLIKPKIRGPDYWKFNNSLLNYYEYSDIILSIIARYCDTNNKILQSPQTTPGNCVKLIFVKHLYTF